MLLAIWNCISIPFEVAFEPEAPDIYTVIEYIIDICFFIDIVLAFRTTFVNKKTGFEVIDSGLIAKNYVKGSQFWIDLLATIPFDLLYFAFVGQSDEDSSTQIKLLGLLKLARLLRLGRIIRYLNFKQGAVLGVKCVQLLSFLVLLVHWIGCIWYILIRDEGSWVPPKDLDRDARDPTLIWTKSEFYDWSIM